MDRVEHALDRARDGLAVTVGQERRNPPFMHPRHRVDVETCLALAGRIAVVPCPALQAAPMVPGPEDEDVTLAEARALGRLAGFELGPLYCLSRLEPFHPPEPGQIE